MATSHLNLNAGYGAGFARIESDTDAGTVSFQVEKGDGTYQTVATINVAAQQFQPRIGTVTGTVATAGTAVNTGAVGVGVTPVSAAYWVASGPEGAAIASYSGGSNGTFSVNAAATGVITVAFLY